MVKNVLFDGTKGISLEQYPPEAWVDLSPARTMVNDSRDDVRATQGYYEAVAVLYRCVEIRANALMRIPWAVMRGDDEVWHSRDREPPQQLEYLKRLRRLLWLTEACLCLAPEAFWFRERNRVRTLDLRWVAPLSVLPVWDESEGLIGFDRMLGGQTRRFDVDDIVYFPRPNPMHETVPGRPPAQASMSAAGVLYNVDAFAAGFFERGAIKATLLTIEGNPPDTELRKLEMWWKRFFSGIKNAWESAAVRMGVNPVTIGEGVQELGNTELTKEKKEDIATGMGVMHSLLFSNSANFATAEQDALNYQALTMVPEFEMILELLNEQLFEPLGLVIQERSQEMPVFQEDETERSVAFKNLVESGIKQSIAAQILGIDLPPHLDYADLDPAEPAQQQFSIVEPQPAQLIDGQAVEQEKSRFRRWASKRKNPKPSQFESDLLTEKDKFEILSELWSLTRSGTKGGNDAAQAVSFPEWSNYP